MIKIFISYARQSQDVVKTLKQDLVDLGNDVWFDKDLAGGHIWWNQVLEKILECDLFIFALSSESLDSYACKLEYTYAFKLNRTILPVLVADDVSINLLPPILSSIQFVDYRNPNKQAVFTLLKTIKNLPTPQPLPDPLPKLPEAPISSLSKLKDQVESRETLNFQEQSTLFLILKKHLDKDDELKDILKLLGLFRKRDDLFAKIAEQIDTLVANSKRILRDERSTEGTVLEETPKTSSSLINLTETSQKWRAELILNTHMKRSLNVYLTQETHLLEFEQGIIANDILKLDGKIVSRTSETTNQKHKFSISDGNMQYDAQLMLNKGALGGIKSFLLIISGNVLYED